MTHSPDAFGASNDAAVVYNVVGTVLEARELQKHFPPLVYVRGVGDGDNRGYGVWI